jgi:hypothetical protein
MPNVTVIVVWGFCLLSVLGESIHSMIVQQFACTLLIVVLAITPGWRWVRRGSGKLALAIAAVALLLTWQHGSIYEALLGTVRYTPVIALLLCVSLIRIPVKASELDITLSGLLSRVGPSSRVRLVTATAASLAPILNLGTIAFLGTFLRGKSIPETGAPVAVTRGVGMAMLWAPTFAPIALVMTAFPNVVWTSTLPIAGTLVTVSIVLSARLSAAIEAGQTVSLRLDRLWVGGALVAIVAGTAVAFRNIAGANITASVSASGISGLLFWVIIIEKRKGYFVSKLTEHTQQIWEAVSAEAALFTASGFLATALQQPYWTERLHEFLGFVNEPTWMSMAWLILGVPALAVIGIHPVVPFSILVHAVTADNLGVAPPVLYMTWVVIWMLSLLVSPASALNISASSSFGISTWEIGFQANWRYGLAFGLAAILILHQWS